MLAFAPRAGRSVLTALGVSAALLAGDVTGGRLIGAARAAESAGGAAAPVAPPTLFSFSDTIVSYRFQGPSAEPGIGVQRPDGTPTGRREPREVPKNVVNLFHANAWTYGTNLVSLDILRSGSQDPAGNAFGSFPEIGATELYLLYRGTLSANRIFDTDVFAIPGLVKEIGLAFGVDANAKDTTFSSQKRAGTFGLNVAVDVPAGFLNLKVQAYKEFAHNGFATGRFRSVEFLMTPEFEVTYAFPLAFTGLPLSLSGFNTIILPKGRYGRTNENRTQLEFVSQTNLVLDVGRLTGGTPNQLEVFAGFQYWHNKFGADPRRTVNTEERALIAGVSYHLK
ncbi:hypothetical protein [Methylobacterium sp. J-090]|uniref:hypothetical protein n=1 Tax=Methylobacterium sp. J-090 TaxID=2836666 RepID=UPI001FB8F2CD|nr:hypothetical protein [Methylobacterium sp. J-090]MCJ2082656.1 hypothetical protein [Methylobacterium sp. J-090]